MRGVIQSVNDTGAENTTLAMAQSQADLSAVKAELDKMKLQISSKNIMDDAAKTNLQGIMEDYGFLKQQVQELQSRPASPPGGGPARRWPSTSLSCNHCVHVDQQQTDG